MKETSKVRSVGRRLGIASLAVLGALSACSEIPGDSPSSTSPAQLEDSQAPAPKAQTKLVAPPASATAAAPNGTAQPQNVPTTQINGLVVIVNLADATFNATPTQISSLMNQPSGYADWGNNGSVRQFWSVESSGHVTLNHQVVTVTLNHPSAYYVSTSTYDGPQAMTNDTVAAINQAYPAGFSGLTMHPTENRLWSFVMLEPVGAGVTFGLADQTLAVQNDGVAMPIHAVAQIGWTAATNPSISTICHELGHLVFGWTDYYVVPTRMNLGHYCVMGSGGNAVSPMPVDPALRLQKGWIDTVTELSSTVTATYTVTANDPSHVFKYTNPNNPGEYLLIEALVHGNYYVAIDGDGYQTDEGLAIWTVDEVPAPPSPAPRIHLVQADGRDNMNDPSLDDGQHHHMLRGDMTDLFDNVSNLFSGATYPAFAWKDGSLPDISISNISAPGATMTFTVNAKNTTCTSTPLTAVGATASSIETSALVASNAIDGNPATRWSSSFADNQWLALDLGVSRSINQVVLTWEAASAADYRIDLSTDGVTWTTAKTFTGGTGARTDTLTGLSAHVGRYVRMFGTRRSTPYGFSLWEMQVSGDSNSTCQAAPTVSLTSPANNGSFTAPAQIVLAASAGSPAAVWKVEFYSGSTLLGTSTTAPYTFTWTNVATGSYALTAKAYDNLNAVTTSSVVNVVVAPAATNPCAGMCNNPTVFSGPNYQSGNLGTGAVCRETTAALHAGNCSEMFGRSLLVNGTAMNCNLWTLPAKHNGGYCIQATAGTPEWSSFATW